MKKLFAILLCLALLGGSALAEMKITACYAYRIEGLNTIGENGELEGFNVALMRTIDDMDDEISIEKDMLFENLDLIRTGAMEGQDGGVILPSYRSFESMFTDFHFGSRPYLSQPAAIVATKSSGIASVADLAGRKVYAEAAEIRDNVEAYNAAHPDAPLDCEFVDISDPFVRVQEVLMAGMADAVITGLLGAYHYAAMEDLDCTVVEIPDGEQLYTVEMWIGYDAAYVTAAFEGVDSVEAQIDLIRDRIEADIDALVADGTYGRLSMEYLGVDLTPYYTFGEAQPEAAVDAEQPAEAEAAADAAAEPEEPAAEKPAVYTDKETVKKVQQALNDAGYSCGTPDGLAGKKTNQAVIDFKAAKGIDDTGADITDALLEALGIG